MNKVQMIDPKLTEVWACLDRVMDPELDEPITDMDFVEEVSLEGGTDVKVTFRLPTYWCSPNFAFLMAQGIKREVDALTWVGRTIVRLEDHMAADEMNAAVNAGGSFSDAFTELRGGEDLEELQEKFDRKAFQRRQEVVIKALIGAGHTVAGVLNMTLAGLRGIAFEDAEQSRQTTRYLEILQRKELARRPDDLAFPTSNGATIHEQDFKSHMELLRSVRINMEFSGSLCRGLKSSRYKEVDLSGDTPTLIDFIRQGDTQPARDRPTP